MVTSDILEARLTAVEAEVAKLRAVVLQPGTTARPWYEQMAGSMRDLPEFEEVARLGREIRLANVPSEPDGAAGSHS